MVVPKAAPPGAPARIAQHARKLRPRKLVMGKTPTEHALMAEFLAACAIIALRALADYVPSDDQSQGGTEQPPRGAHPLTVLSAVLLVFFVLSLAARSHSTIARAVVLFGALMDLTLLLNSDRELGIVSGWFTAMSPDKSKAATASAPGSSPGAPQPV